MGLSVEIVAPARGRRGKGTVNVLDDAGRVLLTDEGDVATIDGRRKLAKRLGTQLKADPKEIEEKITQGFIEAVNGDRERQRDSRLSRNGVYHNGQDRPPEAEDDPHRLARLFVDDHQADSTLTLRYWHEEWHRWGGAAYRIVPEKELRAGLCRRVKQEFDRLGAKAVEQWEATGGVDENGKEVPRPTVRKVTTRLVADVSQALTSLTVLGSDVSSPSWLTAGQRNTGWKADEVLACPNALVHLPSFVAGRSYSCPPTPRFFSPNALDYRFDPDAARPEGWIAFLSALWPGDRETVDTLQEWFGYSLLPDTSQQKILMLIGPRRSGKGTIARVLQRLVGLANVCAPTLAGLGTNFGLWPLLSKTLAIISDARLSGRTDVAVITERLLSISGEDAQTIDRKNLPHVTARLPVRFVILTNELPKLNDPSGALVSRLVVLRMTESWYGREKVGLTGRLLAELPGILLWAIDGWKRLQERDYFVQPESSKALVQDMEDLSGPINAFLRECCEVGPNHVVLIQELYTRWKAWCVAAQYMTRSTA
jgi:putative DNA primase/helicase